MAVRPDVAGAGHTGPHPLPRADANEPGGAIQVDAVQVDTVQVDTVQVDTVQVDAVPVDAVEIETVPVEDAVAAATEVPAGVGGSTAVEPQAPASGIPRWLILLAGLAAATVAVAGLRAVAWLVAPVLLALVVVVAMAPVQGWLRRVGVPRWLATTVLLLLVWSVLLGFVALLVACVAQMAALLPAYAVPAERLINSVVADLNDAGLVSGQLSDFVGQSEYGQVVGLATGLLASLTGAFSTLVLLLVALVFITVESSGFSRRMALVAAERPHLPVAMTLFS